MFSPLYMIKQCSCLVFSKKKQTLWKALLKFFSFLLASHTICAKQPQEVSKLPRIPSIYPKVAPHLEAFSFLPSPAAALPSRLAAGPVRPSDTLTPPPTSRNRSLAFLLPPAGLRLISSLVGKQP